MLKFKWSLVTYGFAVALISFYSIFIKLCYAVCRLPMSCVYNNDTELSHGMGLHWNSRTFDTNTSVLVLELEVEECSWDIRWLPQFMSIASHDSARIWWTLNRMSTIYDTKHQHDDTIALLAICGINATAIFTTNSDPFFCIRVRNSFMHKRRYTIHLGVEMYGPLPPPKSDAITTARLLFFFQF